MPCTMSVISELEASFAVELIKIAVPACLAVSTRSEASKRAERAERWLIDV